MNAVSLSIVVPCYNEEAVLPECVRTLDELLDRLTAAGKVTPDSCMILVDDGSKDRTWDGIVRFSKTMPRVRGLKLSRNRGHQSAVIAGLFSAGGEAVISVDADLQDDLNAVEEMVERFAEGFDVVFGVRQSRKTDTIFKRMTAEGYYWLLDKLGVDVVFNHADYRLLSRRAIEALRQYGEVNLFLRGVVPQLGYSSCSVFYDRRERVAGESKYPLGKMLAFAWQGVTSFSAVPLRAITALGFLISVGSFAFAFWALIAVLLHHSLVPGWASTVVPLFMLGGVQLLCLGIIGEYLAKVYVETKRRPSFFIDRKVDGGTETRESPTVATRFD